MLTRRIMEIPFPTPLSEMFSPSHIRNDVPAVKPNEMSMIPVKEDMSHIFELNAAIDRGEIVSMPADRVYGSQKTANCMFLGTEARFPLGAFAMAAQKKVPMLSVFVMKEAYRTYHAFVCEIRCDREAKIREQMSQLAQNFATDLEKIVRRYPTQWFNYFDFWKQ